ncbi:Protein SMG9 [Ananas comosus]|uniref:Protein SMG9 n=1 Tax=Ananas comosus TaxID=4615 RepID=A0A199V1R2_ANACO|nr:Protein SMG9 [Ananas comosus]
MAAGGAPPPPPPTTSLSSSSSSPGLPPPPKILLAKPSPGGAAAAAAARVGRDDDPSAAAAAAAAIRSRNAPQPGSLGLVSDAWELQTDRFLTENSDFVVIGIIGPPGVGKSTIMNELYGFDGSSPGMLPPFSIQSDETRAMAKHCTAGIELRVSSERLILLDTQPVYSPSLLVDMMRPDGSSTIPVLNGEPLSADLAHEMMGIQVDLLKHNIPDPSLLAPSNSQGHNVAPDKENSNEEYLADLVFIHTKLWELDFSSSSITLLKKALSHHFNTASFNVTDSASQAGSSSSQSTEVEEPDSTQPRLLFLPQRVPESSTKFEVESFSSGLGKLRDKILSMNPRSFSKNISERDWLRGSAKIWDLVKKSPVIADYCRTLQSTGLFRK